MMSRGTSAGDRPDHMLEEMREQPAVLARIAAMAPAEIGAAGSIESVVFSGSGDSFCAAELGAYACRSAGRVAIALRPLELARYRHDTLVPGTVLVAISASGRTGRVIEAAQVAAARGARVIGVTDAAASPLARLADANWLLHASPPEALERTGYSGAAASAYVGYHHDVPQTKTFLASVAWGMALAKPDDDLLTRLPDLVRTILEADGGALSRAARMLAAARDVVFVGSGPGRAVARYASYKMHEFTRGASVQEMEEYCHTHYFSTAPGTVVALIVHDEWSADRAAEIAPVLRGDIGAETITLTTVSRPDLDREGVVVEVPGASGGASAVALAVAVQRLAHAFARTAGFSTSTFRGGVDTERYVAGSQKTIRESSILPPAELGVRDEPAS